MPLNANTGGQNTSHKNTYNENKYLTEDQARHVYRKVESGNIINFSTLKQEIDQDWELNKLDDTSRDINPYRELIVNNAGKIETVLSQMEQWSILSSIVNYIQYDRHPKDFHNLNISAVNKDKYKKLKYRRRGEISVRIRFWRHTREIKGRISRCIQRDTIRNTKHYKIWWEFRFEHSICKKSKHD